MAPVVDQISNIHRLLFGIMSLPSTDITPEVAMHCLRLSGRFVACYDVYIIRHKEKHPSLSAGENVR